jgi:RNA polymerase sigma-70 factor (ECF subfamily)
MKHTDEIEALYRLHADEVYRFAYRLSGSREQAEDLTAETFVRAIAGADGLRAETVRAFLFTITRRLFLQGLRRSNRETAFDLEVIDPSPSPAERLERSDELARARDGLAGLSEIDRTALLLRAEIGLSYEEIARTLAISVASAKVKIHRARRKLSLGLAEGS